MTGTKNTAARASGQQMTNRINQSMIAINVLMKTEFVLQMSMQTFCQYRKPSVAGFISLQFLGFY
jgi:hypothetical protein